ncbi:hypothetical protein JHK84_040026 [Glycine max]|nr:hypothetical protein JHK86_039814 [Glycine max]KAG4965418.1 hypothetical protein JHK85_040393 [Glycine max]KAG5121686.1 hypothetical protein JHK84_040026 [Glycine max]
MSLCMQRGETRDTNGGRGLRSRDVSVFGRDANFTLPAISRCARLCNFMARIPDKIRSIDGSKETLKLAVRITDLWFVGTPNKSEQAEMVFVDSEGDQIHAICKSDHLKSWKADLKENFTYVMHNFKVVKNDGQFRLCEHEYKLFFIGVTVVREADLHELSFKEFRFVEFANVVAGNFVSGLLVDIIGVVDQVVFRHVSLKNTRVVFRMKDLRLLDLGVEVSQVLLPGDQASSQVSGGSQLSSMDSFLSKAEAKTILEINVISEDRECAELIGQTADDVNRVKIEDGDLDLNASPQALDKLLGHVLAFKVRIQSRFKNAVVLKYSKDLDLINVVLEMLPDSEMFFSDIYFSRCCHDDMIHEFDYHQLIYGVGILCFMQQSLSVTTDHDPVAGLPLTPKKRMSSDEADDELGSSQISPAQLSSNKLTRHSHRS